MQISVYYAQKARKRGATKVFLYQKASARKNALSNHAQSKEVSNVLHFTGDGYSGTNFNCPGFQFMIAEVEAGRVSTIITKDLNFIGRNDLETRFYTEVMFPQKDIHFIAVNNSIDSADSGVNDFAPFLNIMNESCS